MSDTEDTVNVIAEDSIYGYIGLFGYVTYVGIIALVFLINSVKQYQDFFTTERKSLNRSQRPKINGSYTAIAALTSAVCIFFLVADIFQLTTYGLAKTEEACDVLQTAAGICYQSATCFMYLLLLARLYWTYAESKSPVSLNKIIVCSMVIVCYNMIIILVMSAVWTSMSPFDYDGLDKLPNYCEATLEPITAVLITLQEVVVTLAYLYVFHTQIKIAEINQDSSDVVYAGRQLFVLSAVSMVSTSVLVIVTFATGYSFVIGFDPVINVIAVILLEPYYPWKLYVYCCCCCRLLIGQCFCCEELKYDGKDKPSYNVSNGLMLAVKLASDNDTDKKNQDKDNKTEMAKVENDT